MFLVEFGETSLLLLLTTLYSDLKLSRQVNVLISADFLRHGPRWPIMFHPFELIVDGVDQWLEEALHIFKKL